MDKNTMAMIGVVGLGAGITGSLLLGSRKKEPKQSVRCKIPTCFRPATVEGYCAEHHPDMEVS